MENNETKNSSKIVIALMTLVIIALLGYIVYAKFIQKDSTNTNNENNEQQVAAKDIEITEPKEYKVVEKVTYKSKDGKNELVIEPSGEETYVYFNSKKLSATFTKSGKYILVEANEPNENAQCATYSYIINLDDNSLVDLYTDKLLYINKINDNYYFSEAICAEGDVAVYSEGLKKVGTSYIGYDKKNFYILDKNVVKYDSNGKVVGKTQESFELNSNDDAHLMTQTIDGSLYILLGDKTNIYLVDTRDLNVITIGKTSDYAFGGYEGASMHVEDGKLSIGLMDLNNNNELLTMYYDTSSKQLTK